MRFRTGASCRTARQKATFIPAQADAALGRKPQTVTIRGITGAAESFTEYDSVPLGIFIVDGSTIRRQADTITFRAYDRLVLFDRSTFAMTNTLYNLISAACGSFR